MILDGETFEPVGAVDVFLRESEELDLPGRLKTEMHASIVELNTGICADAAESVAALGELRAAADAIARRNGLRIAARVERSSVSRPPRYGEFTDSASTSGSHWRMPSSARKQASAESTPTWTWRPLTPWRRAIGPTYATMSR